MTEGWIVGHGYMGSEYARVVSNFGVPFAVITRSKKKIEPDKALPLASFHSGGLRSFLATKPKLPKWAILAVPVVQLKDCAIALMEYGVKTILVEKPGGLTLVDIEQVYRASEKHQATLPIAYNRRFLSSVLKAKEMIAAEGGALSMYFDFTERIRVIESFDIDADEKKNLFLNNSSHVIDLAFFLGGEPRELSTYRSGGLKWHPSGSIYCGAGVTNSNVLFSYSANWDSPGRWGVEILTRKTRIVLRPLEQLHIQHDGVQPLENIALNVENEKLFKPGVHEMVGRFLKNDFSLFCTMKDQFQRLNTYQRISGY